MGMLPIDCVERGEGLNSGSVHMERSRHRDGLWLAMPRALRCSPAKDPGDARGVTGACSKRFEAFSQDGLGDSPGLGLVGSLGRRMGRLRSLVRVPPTMAYSSLLGPN